MTPRSLKQQTILRTGIVLVILVLLNFVSIRLFGRFDMTRNHIFTLSDASKTLMRGLDDKVTVKAYFTDDLPSPYNSNRREVLDELNEYRAYAGGNLQFEFISPSGEKGEREAQQQGIAPLQVQVIKEDKAQVQRAYMGMVFLYADKREVIPVVQNTSNLEYEVSSTIKRLTAKGQKTIGFLSGQGEPVLTELKAIQDILRKQYELAPVDVSKGAAVPENVAALVIMAPSTSFTEAQKFQIDQYLMRGGRIAFLLNRVEASLQKQYGRALDLNLDDMLDAYGVRINADLIRDVQCASVSIMQQQFGFNFQSQVPFPYLPTVSNFSKDNAMVKDLQGVVLFFASSVDTTRLGARGLAGEVLMRSSKQSGRQTGVFTYDPLQQFTRADFPENGIPLGAIVQGRFTSCFQGKSIPTDTAAGSTPPPATPLTTSPDTRIILVGDGDFARDQFLGGSRDNVTLFANMMDFLVDDAGLITIRTKEQANPPLEPVSDGTKQAIKYATLGLPPLLVLAYGLFRWRMRKARKKAMEIQ
jgi:gliding-associated putative ABC transporter substrate-binding component GldG